MFRKKTIPQQRKALRTKIRKLEKKPYGTPRTASRLFRLRANYERLGIQFWQNQPFDGLDLTGATLTDEDGNVIDKDQFMKIATTYVLGPLSPQHSLKAEGHTRTVYTGGVPSTEQTGRGSTVEFRTVDGHMQMYRDGIEEGMPRTPESMGWGEHPEPPAEQR